MPWGPIVGLRGASTARTRTPAEANTAPTKPRRVSPPEGAAGSTAAPGTPGTAGSGPGSEPRASASPAVTHLAPTWITRAPTTIQAVQKWAVGKKNGIGVYQ